MKKPHESRDFRSVTVLGAGKLGQALIKGWLNEGTFPPTRIRAVRRKAEAAEKTAADLGVAVGTDAGAALKGAEVVILAVKPQNMADLLHEVRDRIPPQAVVVSVAASVPTPFIEEHLPPGRSVVRVMPNTPCLVRAGMSVLCPGAHASGEQVEKVERLFRAVGRTQRLDDERLMEAVTALSGSGPAYLYVVIESLAEAGVKVGLPRDVATLLAAQTVYGAASMVLEQGRHPAVLKDEVTTPAGCTIDGLLKLEEGGLRVTLIKAVVEATERAKALRPGR